MRLVCQEVITTYVFVVSIFLVFIIGVPLTVGFPFARHVNTLVSQTRQLNIGFSLAAILAGLLLISKTAK